MPAATHTGAKAAFALGAFLFLVFVANLFVAGILKRPAFLSDVQDMLALFVAVGCFVLGIVLNEVDSDASEI
jgi:hypothetical protein